MPKIEYQKYQEACARIKKNNAKLLNEFRHWLANKGLKEGTVDRHVR